MLCNRVKYLRRSEGFDLTQEQLANELGVSRQTIVELEKGRPPSAELLLKVADFFNKDPREIFFSEIVVSNLQRESSKVSTA
ncbi:helix-turn-helix transcriptional regulator [Bacillus sp. FJAT-45350]|uniref:helix-turn-helix transcriptional regulator n=1 Tax=Bacillus sp. FJAT-45350 TaxID=2011014 RepID=UPI000BB71AF9|nr:helix-turn-helix transcriptional regulator [Bacillus sp. FJAT-45350]